MWTAGGGPLGLVVAPGDSVSLCTARVSAALRREVVARVLAGHAATPGGLTYAQLARLVGRAVAAADPTGASRRQAQARRDRYVTHHRPQTAGEEGRLVAAGPAERVAICAETVEAIARGWARAGVPGTLDQLRFDALAVADRPGRRAPGHPGGAVVSADRTDAGVRVGPGGCGVCASRGCTARHGLQIDHDEPYPQGATSASNNVPLHQPHHDGKTCGAWRHRLDPRTGALRQVSPLGRAYKSRALAPLGGVLGGPPGLVDEAALSAEDLARRPAPPPEPPPARTRRPPTHPTLR